MRQNIERRYESRSQKSEVRHPLVKMLLSDILIFGSLLGIAFILGKVYERKRFRKLMSAESVRVLEEAPKKFEAAKYVGELK